MPAFLKQKVNQWLCIALIGLMCFWTVLYYFTHKTIDIADNIISDRASYLDKTNKDIK